MFWKIFLLGIEVDLFFFQYRHLPIAFSFAGLDKKSAVFSPCVSLGLAGASPQAAPGVLSGFQHSP